MRLSKSVHLALAGRTSIFMIKIPLSREEPVVEKEVRVTEAPSAED